MEHPLNDRLLCPVFNMSTSFQTLFGTCTLKSYNDLRLGSGAVLPFIRVVGFSYRVFMVKLLEPLVSYLKCPLLRPASVHHTIKVQTNMKGKLR